MNSWEDKFGIQEAGAEISEVRSSCDAAGRCWASTDGTRLGSPWPYYRVSLLNRDLAMGVQTAAGQREHLLLELNPAIPQFHLNLLFFYTKP